VKLGEIINWPNLFFTNAIGLHQDFFVAF
jgi:hypothetical protein